MRTLSRSLTPLLTLSGVVSCVPSAPTEAEGPTPAKAAAPPASPWQREVEARIRDAAHAPERRGSAWFAASPERGLHGTFDLDGAWLVSARGEIGVRTVAWGRPHDLRAADLDEPAEGDCVPDAEGPEGDCVRRLERTNGELLEWWSATAEGLEQGWTVAAPPVGAGPLVVALAVDGGAVSAGDGEIRLLGDDGEDWVVSAFSAWDAEGRALALTLAPTTSGFALQIDDADARYPIEIDPVYDTATTTLTGGASSNQFGFSVSGAGDVDGDGFDDIIVGAYGYSSKKGRVYVYHGSATGVSTTATTTLTGAGTSYYFGYSVSGAGDVNGDGYDDVIISALNYSYFKGQVYVYHGSASGVSSTATTTVTGTTVYTYMGNSVSGAGDVNGDGYDDVIIGTPAYDSSAGKADVYYGSASGVSTTGSTTLTGGTKSFFGGSVSDAGDVNGDGYDDVIVGAYLYNSYTGQACVFHGSASGISTTAATTLTGEDATNYFGTSVPGAGDVNGDGYDDVIVGAAGYSSYTGRAYVYQGSASGVSTTAATTLTGENASDELGGAVSDAGDVDGDGYDDVIVGASGYSSSQGQAAVYHGSASGISTTAATTVTGEDASAELGYAVSGAGDVDGDGFDDVLVGAYAYSSHTGKVTIYHGYADVDLDGDGSFASEDCDDTNNAAYPGADEICDSVDNDCDGDIDESTDNPLAIPLYVDADGDTYGSTATGDLTLCDPRDGYAINGDDCDDANPAINPSATEICDAADTDEDCDGLADDADDDVLGKSTFYEDADGDGYGGPPTGAFCDLPSGYAESSTDCDDTDAAINPGATEVCDASDTDEDCDGLADDADTAAAGKTPFYEDADGDGYGGATAVSSCDLPSGYLATSTDCDDTDAAINPGATEVCDAADTDEDCDGLADDADTAASGKSSFYLDADGDGYGDGALVEAFCDLPSGYVRNNADCDDTDPDAYLGAPEVVGDEIDEDCDGGEVCYADADGDGYTDGSGVVSADADCADAGELPDGGATGDCDDADAAYNPGAPETDCTDPNDYNCDGSTAYADADADGWAACEDCDDADNAVNPAATEVPGDGTDEDCDGEELCLVDADDDGYVADPDVTLASDHLACDGEGEADATAAPGDCDDGDAAFNPGADEPDCTDPNDYNCDGSTGYADADADGWAACAECDDADSAVNPAASEVCDGVDDDCDGTTDLGASDAVAWYADGDGDGYTDPDQAETACAPSEGYAAASAEPDCDDTDPGVHPGAEDLPEDGVDQDCDGEDAATADTGDAGDTDAGDTGEIGDTSDTADIGDTGDTDAGDTDATASSDDSKDAGCGCGSGGPRGGWLAVLGLAAIARRRRSDGGALPSFGRS